MALEDVNVTGGESFAVPVVASWRYTGEGADTTSVVWQRVDDGLKKEPGAELEAPQWTDVATGTVFTPTADDIQRRVRAAITAPSGETSYHEVYAGSLYPPVALISDLAKLGAATITFAAGDRSESTIVFDRFDTVALVNAAGIPVFRTSLAHVDATVGPGDAGLTLDHAGATVNFTAKTPFARDAIVHLARVSRRRLAGEDVSHFLAPPLIARDTARRAPARPAPTADIRRRALLLLAGGTPPHTPPPDAIEADEDAPFRAGPLVPEAAPPPPPATAAGEIPAAPPPPPSAPPPPPPPPADAQRGVGGGFPPLRQIPVLRLPGALSEGGGGGRRPPRPPRVWELVDDRRVRVESGVLDVVFRGSAADADAAARRARVGGTAAQQAAFFRLDAAAEQNFRLVMRGDDPDAAAADLAAGNFERLRAPVVAWMRRAYPAAEADVGRLAGGRYDRESPAVRVLAAMAAVPRVRLVLAAVALRRELDDARTQYMRVLANVADTAAAVMASERLRRLLEIVLATLNYLNQGGPYARQHGFDIAMLGGLAQTKTVHPDVSFLHYLVRYTRAHEPEGAGFFTALFGDFPLLADVAKVQYATLRGEVRRFRKEAVVLDEDLARPETRAAFAATGHAALYRATVRELDANLAIKSTVIALGKRAEFADRAGAALHHYFGLDAGRGADPVAVFITLDAFREDIKKAESEWDVIIKTKRVG